MSSTDLDPEKVRYISLVRKEGGEPILGIPYREMSVDPDLVASFVLAVVIFENRQLRTFVKEGYVVLIEEGKYIIGLLIIDKVENQFLYREALRLIINSLEANFEQQLENWVGDIRPFREFALFILKIFPYRVINIDLVPALISRSDAAPDHQAKIPWAVGEVDEKLQTIVGYINGKRTIREIIEASKFEKEEAIALFSMLEKYNWITLTRPVKDDSFLVKISEPPSLLIGFYGEKLIRIVELCNGTKTLLEICNEMGLNIDVVKTIARNLIDAGVLTFKDIVQGGDNA